MELTPAPSSFIDRLSRWHGAAAARWARGLPERAAAFCHRWNLTPDGQPFYQSCLILPVRRDDEPCMLKLAWPGDEAVGREALALASWDGRGAVKLLASAPDEGALLLERLDRGRSLQDLQLEDALTVAGRLLRRLAVTAPEGVPVQNKIIDQLVRALPEQWSELGRPFSRSIMEKASKLAADLRQPQGAVLVNYDLHYGNVLAGAREPWLCIDPKVVAAVPEYGVAQLLWTRLDEMSGARRFKEQVGRLVDAAQLDHDLARRWSYVRCVEYWLWALSVGLTEDPRRCETVVGWLE